MVSFTTSTLALVIAALSMSTVDAKTSLRTNASDTRRLGLVPDYGFVVSHIAPRPDGRDWCLTAAYGAAEFAKLGFRRCDYEGAPLSQQFKFDADGKLHSALDDSKCMILNHGDALFDGVRMRLADCDTATFLNKFSLEAEEDHLKVVLPFAYETESCITNRGPVAHNGDTIHAKPCKDRGDYKWTFKTSPTCNELIINGGFEDGFTAWSVDDSGACSTVLNDGTVDPPGPSSTTTPIEGNFDALTTQDAPGLCRLKQSVTLPPNFVSATLSWKDRVRSDAGFSDPIQESRVAVCVDGGVSAPVEVWSTNPGDPTQQIGPNARSFDVTSILQGLSTADIRLDQQDNMGWFNMNWDAVALNICSW